jgi:hypothetical protein
MERTSSGLPTDIPTDRQVQSNMPLFFEGGIKMQYTYNINGFRLKSRIPTYLFVICNVAYITRHICDII